MTYAELHAQHPTPWVEYCSDNGFFYATDANGNKVGLQTVVAMMNEAAKEIAKSRGAVEAVIEITGYSPECVAACIRAVQALRDSEDPASLEPIPQDKCLSAIADDAIDAAIALLPERTRET